MGFMRFFIDDRTFLSFCFLQLCLARASPGSGLKKVNGARKG